MSAAATTPVDVQLDVGDTWTLGVAVPAGSTVAVQVTSPSGDTATPTPVTTGGRVAVQVPLEEAGRYLAVVTVTGETSEVIPFTAHAAEPTATDDLPDVEELKGYLGDTSATDDEIEDALDAEMAAQLRLCDVPAAYPDDLRQALKRRVARNLAARGVPIAQFTSFDTGAVTSRVTRTDAEVVRLEAPFRKVVVG
jgi:hypothetical protein